jgi:hypothetical protein
MALIVFLVGSTLWVLGLMLLGLRCVRLEGPYDPFGEIGAFAGTGWLRGSTPQSRRWRSWTLGWMIGGATVLVAITVVARALERLATL